ncbi:MAG: uroporphyrinogen-III C-methyltransferase [Brevinematales bacterium]|nr:uroporphyrinogen-III C-methyltransferase [Brevinematales bacterium]
MKGIVYIVGSGPGDKNLITVKGAKILAQCDVVVYDYLCGTDVLEHCKEECEKICAESFSRNHSGDRITKMYKFIISKVKEGKKVVRLKGGDPSIFARLTEEEKILLENKIEYRVIPGVTAGLACASYYGISLTSRHNSPKVSFITAHESQEKSISFIEWNKIGTNETLVIYMGVEKIKEVSENLIKISKLSPNTPVLAISNISKLNQKHIISSLDNIHLDVTNHNIKPPTIFIVGDIVKDEEILNWYKRQKKIIFTGISEERFFEEGIIFHIPMVKIVPLDDYSELKMYITRVSKGEFDWIVFCSRYGVLYFFKSLLEMGFDSRTLGSVKISAIGMSTANALKNHGIIPDLVPQNESSEGLLEAFRNVPRGRIFMPRSDLSDKGLGNGFKNLGFEVEECIAYRNIMPQGLPDIEFSLIDEIIFTSPSTIRNFIKRYNKIPENVNIRCIGPKTENELRKILPNF